MPVPSQRPAPIAPASPRSTAKYTNKDGSKFITVPKTSPSDSSQPPTPTAAGRSISSPPAPRPVEIPAMSVNRKKQKRRQKAMAKAAATEQTENVDEDLASRILSGLVPIDQDATVTDDEALSGEHASPGTNGHPDPSSKLKKKKKKKRNMGGYENADEAAALSITLAQASSQGGSRPSGMSRDKIWSTSNHEERERIKEFWLGLGEDERKSLVKVEKDAVLKKMKEQQKHTCSCTVCGRKRTAIEEELEGLYDAYYLELEQFANQRDSPPMLPPSASQKYPFPPPRSPSTNNPLPPPRGRRLIEHFGVNGELEGMQVYSDDEVEDDDEFSDDEPAEKYHNPYDRDMTDFLTFGNSLQVKGGILTVADDLLKNDGKRFIEMMEQLAERRMAREEDAREHYPRGYAHPDGSYSNSHNHPPPEDEEYEEEEDEEEYEDSQDEEYEDEEDPMTEEQRMEEGRRMFQIFAARMFEQRVLSAYKEKVAKERQDKLLEELEEESRQVDEQKAKKAKNAQKKKDKAAQKKQAQAEEKARKEAEKAAEEAARLEAEQKKVGEQKQKAEEKRKHREAQRKAEEEARLKKEADRQKRQNEQREKQAELERRAREAKERDKRLKEEQRLKEKEAREDREREASQRKEKQDRDKREKEARAAKVARESQETTQRPRDEKVMSYKSPSQPPLQSQPLQIPKRTQAQPHPLVTVLPQHPSNPANLASPKVPIATPAVSKAPTPIRARTTSQQHEPGIASSVASQSASTTSRTASPHSGTQVQPSPGPHGQDRKLSAGGSIIGSQLAQPSSPHSTQSKAPNPSSPFPMAATMGMQPPPGLAHHRPPGFPSPMAQEPMFPIPFRPAPNLMMAPPGISSPMSAGRGFPSGPVPPPGFTQSSADAFPIGQGFQPSKEMPIASHARQPSTGFAGPADAPAQPIGRPAPIGRPMSLSQGAARNDDEDTKRLGSRVLVDDDEPSQTEMNTGSLRNQNLGPPAFPASPFQDAAFPMAPSLWGPAGGVGQHFPPPGLIGQTWGSPTMPPGFGVGSPAAAMMSSRPSSQPRHVAVRLMLCQTCQDLARAGRGDNDGYIDLGTVKSQMEAQNGDLSNVTEEDLLDLCDTEGSCHNGGGTFDIRHSPGRSGKAMVRWVPESSSSGPGQAFRAVGAPGEIGSPLTNHASLRGF